jgi:hypothetical protein
MNIFQVHSDPVIAAQSLVDKHVIKMILESAQLLSTAHRVLDGTEKTIEKYVNGSLPARYRKAKRWLLSDSREDILYSATHVNHPSAVWCRKTNNNYNWLYAHFLALISEYEYRYGKVHKCKSLADTLCSTPYNIPVGYLSQVTPAMPEEYIVKLDSVSSYRNYYKNAKKHLHKWTKRQPPEWLTD